MLYHVTTKENAKRILKEGLRASIGDNSSLIGEDEKAVYLCRRSSVKQWRILLDRHTVLGIDEKGTEGKDVHEFAYDSCKELIVYGDIAPEYIKRVYIPKDDRDVMQTLCRSYIYSISHFCVSCARYYYHRDNEKKPDSYVLSAMENVKHYITVLSCILPRLDYSVLDKQEIRDQLRSMYTNDYTCTICDYYADENKRLYQKLVEFPKDDFYEGRKFIYQFIKQNFKGCLRVNTGSWLE